MNLQNGYKVVYEIAADGKRTFYASKSEIYPSTEDVELATFTDAEYAGKVIYEYKGEFYVSNGSLPAYDENGVPTDTKIAGFDKVLVAETAAVATTKVTDGGEVTTGDEDEPGTDGDAGDDGDE